MLRLRIKAKVNPFPAWLALPFLATAIKVAQRIKGFAGMRVRTILVTGGAGFIGSHTCKAFAAAGLTPISYDNLSTGHAWAVKWGPLEVGDVRNRGRLDEVLSSFQPDAVIHFAASAYVGESVANPGKYYSNNVVGTLRLLEAMTDHAVPYLIFSSSHRDGMALAQGSAGHQTAGALQ